LVMQESVVTSERRRQACLPQAGVSLGSDHQLMTLNMNHCSKKNDKIYHIS
jgi:hypothetical protein